MAAGAAPYPIIEHRTLGKAEKARWFSRKSRRADEIPRPEAHQALVYRVGSDFVVDNDRMSPVDERVINATNVSVVDMRRDALIVAALTIPSADASYFDVLVTFTCTVVDAMVVVKGGIDAREALQGHLKAHNRIFELGLDFKLTEVNEVRRMVGAQVKAYLTHVPARVPGLQVRFASVEVSSPKAVIEFQEKYRSTGFAHQLDRYEQEHLQLTGESPAAEQRRVRVEAEQDLWLHRRRSEHARAEFEANAAMIGGDPKRALLAAFAAGELDAEGLSAGLKALDDSAREATLQDALATRADQRRLGDREYAERREDKRYERAVADRQLEMQFEMAKQMAAQGHYNTTDVDAAKLFAKVMDLPDAAPSDHDTGAVDAEDIGDLSGRVDEDEGEPARTESGRWLTASLPARATVDAEIDLILRILAAAPTSTAVVATELRNFVVPASGARLLLVVEASPGIRALTAARQTVLVPASGDSDPVRFPFRVMTVGMHDVTVTAWLGGTFVGEVQLQVSVGADAQTVQARTQRTRLGPLVGRPGEATLQILLTGDQYTFQLMIDDELFDTVPGGRLTAEPIAAIEQARRTLHDMASGASRYSGPIAARRLEGMGAELWDGMVPGELKDQFWSVRDKITMLTVASSKDVMPWELVYPLAPGRDAGFLAQQFPVMRRVHGQHRAKSLCLDNACFVVSAASPTNASAEVDAIRTVLGMPRSAGDVVADLKTLLELIESGASGLVHFACHNSFDSVAGGALNVGGERLVPDLLKRAATVMSLRERSSLIFLNACTSGVDVHRYSGMSGFASQFMRAGAGGFVGTLWDVRSGSAARFAELFYAQLGGGASLGEATFNSRNALRTENPADPTWLAYTVYGDPGCSVLGG